MFFFIMFLYVFKIDTTKLPNQQLISRKVFTAINVDSLFSESIFKDDSRTLSGGQHLTELFPRKQRDYSEH